MTVKLWQVCLTYILFINCYQEIRIVQVLNKHTGRVNAVQWVHKQDCSKSFIAINKCQIGCLQIFQFEKVKSFTSCIDIIQLSVTVRHKWTCRNVSWLFLQVRKPSWCLVGRIIMLLSGRSRMGRYVCTITINMDTYADNIIGLFLLRNTLDKILNKSTAIKDGFVFNINIKVNFFLVRTLYHFLPKFAISLSIFWNIFWITASCDKSLMLRKPLVITLFFVINIFLFLFTHNITT